MAINSYEYRFKMKRGYDSEAFLKMRATWNASFVFCSGA